MANTLKTWITPNTVTTDPNDKILVLESTGKADINKQILGEKADVMYIFETEDRKTGLKDGSMTPEGLTDSRQPC